MSLSRNEKTGRKKRQRATAEQTSKYGTNPRKNLVDYAPIRQRLQYVCDVVFSGNQHEMAHAAGVCYRQLYRILYGQSRLTMPVAAQIVSKIGIRAEWLLVGSGSLFPTGDDVECFDYVPRILSNYAHFDTHAAPPAYPHFNKVDPPAAVDLSFLRQGVDEAFLSASRVIYEARVAQKPICLFLDAPNADNVDLLAWKDFYLAGHVNSLFVTLSAVFNDVRSLCLSRPVDLNSFAIHAARLGAGYGETFCKYVCCGLLDEDQEKIKKSLIMRAYRMQCPVFLSGEIGEISSHTNPAVRAPELGAALGAAVYTDLLAFTETVPSYFGDTGGVVICPHNVSRFARIFLARLPSLRLVAPDQTGFTFICFGDPASLTRDDLNTLKDISVFGGRVILLPPARPKTVVAFSAACHRLYLGLESLAFDLEK